MPFFTIEVSFLNNSKRKYPFPGICLLKNEGNLILFFRSFVNERLNLIFETIESQIFKHRRKPWFRAYIKDLFSNFHSLRYEPKMNSKDQKRSAPKTFGDFREEGLMGALGKKEEPIQE